MANPSAPASKNVDALTGKSTTGHEWDGIRELNTPLPSWWLYTFYACIAFALVWVVLYPSLPNVPSVTGWTARGAIDGVVRGRSAGRMLESHNRLCASSRSKTGENGVRLRSPTSTTCSPLSRCSRATEATWAS